MGRMPWLLLGVVALLGACGPNGTASGAKDVGAGFNPTSGTDGTDPSDGTDGTELTDSTDTTQGTDSTGSTDGTDGTVPTDVTDVTDGTDGTDTKPTDLPDFIECESDSDCPGELPTCAPQGICILCYPGTFQCDTDKSMQCDQYGTLWTLIEDCALTGAVCNPLGGKCESGCGGGGLGKTNAGCDFYAIDMRNAYVSDPLSGTLDAQNAQFAVIASNTTDQPAKVSVSLPDGSVKEKTVAPGGLEKFLLPSTFGLKGTGRTKSAYRITSSQPVTAYQFNPLSNAGVFSNDASVLLPLSGMGSDYFVVTRAQTTDDFRGYVVIAGIAASGTEVTVKPSAATKAGGDVPAISKGGSHTFTLAEGEVIAIESAAIGDDLTGSRVTADKAVAVFSGHVAAVTSTKCCADHLEQQLVPVTAWGKEYVFGRSWERGGEKDYFRVVAASPNTVVAVSPAVTNPVSKTLQAGQFWEFTSDQHVRVSANNPISVTQFLASSQEVGPGDLAPCVTDADCGSSAYSCFIFCTPKFCSSAAECGNGHTCYQGQCSPTGDPAMMVGVPFEQWQTSYVFLTPDSYVADYVNIVAPEAATVSLDGVPLGAGAFEKVVGTNFKVYRAEVPDGTHTVTSDQKVSITVYGYDKDVSYGYPGGLGLSSIAP